MGNVLEILGPATLFVALLFTPAAAGTIVFTETDWGPGSVTSISVQGVNGGQTAAQANGGTPAAAYRVTTNTVSTVFTAHMLTGATIDPTLNALTSVGFSIDFTPISAFGQGQAVGLVLRQGGNYFTSAGGVTGSSGPGTFDRTGALAFVESDFTDRDAFNGSGNPVDQLNFSGGGVIEFGFITGNSGGPGITIDYDSVRIEAAAVPVPAALPLAMSGVFGLALVARRRKKRRPDAL